MSIKQYDKVLLTDGRTATIVEVFEHSFVADIETLDGDYDTQFIQLEHIKSVL